MGRGWGVAYLELNFLLVLKPAHAQTAQSGINISQHLLILSKVLISTQNKRTTVGFKKIPVTEMGTGTRLYFKDSVNSYTEKDFLDLFATKKKCLRLSSVTKLKPWHWSGLRLDEHITITIVL